MTMKGQEENNNPVPVENVNRRRAMESVATIGLLLLAVGLVAPFTDIYNATLMTVFKWVFTAGAVVYLAARVAGCFDKSLSRRIRNMSRMQVWAGVCFAAAAGMWFYNTGRYPVMSLRVMQDTVAFTLAGAVIQIIFTWALARQTKKENGANNGR